MISHYILFYFISDGHIRRIRAIELANRETALPKLVMHVLIGDLADLHSCPGMKLITGSASRSVIPQDYSTDIEPYNPEEHAKRRDKSPLAKEWVFLSFTLVHITIVLKQRVLISRNDSVSWNRGRR